MSDEPFDLDAYLTRISYTGSREPVLAVLNAVVTAHAHAIPYEDIDVFLMRGVRIDIASVQHKLVTSGRGGYCFEQNALLAAALDALGFAVTRLRGRVMRGLPISVITPAGHQVLRVDLAQGAFIVDVGFGNLTPTAPIPLHPWREHATPHEPFRLMPLGAEFMLQARLGYVWDSLYRFSQEPVPPVDYEVANWFTSTRPGGLFVSNLIAAMPVEIGRMTLFNRRLTIRDRDNRTTRRLLEAIDDYRDVLVTRFGLALDDNDLGAIVEAMARHPADEAVHQFFA